MYSREIPGVCIPGKFLGLYSREIPGFLRSCFFPKKEEEKNVTGGTRTRGSRLGSNHSTHQASGEMLLCIELDYLNSTLVKGHEEKSPRKFLGIRLTKEFPGNLVVGLTQANISKENLRNTVTRFFVGTRLPRSFSGIKDQA